MKTKLKELVDTQQICSVYTDLDATNKFAVGYILQFNENYFVMESIDQYGKSDGVFCSLVDNIIKIETNSIYNECIQKLFEFSNQIRYRYTKAKGDILVGLIDHIIANKKLSTIELCNSGTDDTVGFIKRVDKETIEIEVIDQYGKKDGTQKITIADISHITCDSMDDFKTETLFKINSK